MTVPESIQRYKFLLSIIIGVRKDVLFAIHDWALGISPVTSYSGVKEGYHWNFLIKVSTQTTVISHPLRRGAPGSRAAPTMGISPLRTSQ